jgi:transposase InsO family protein
VFGVSRQSYYQREDSFYEGECMKGFVMDYVRELRTDFPRMGCYKLYEKSKTYFGATLPFGRDSFFCLLREQGLMLKIKKRRVTKTTDSSHPFTKYANLIKDYKAECSCRLWVSDITYIAYTGGFFYLSLITDAYSRKIVGWELADTLKCIHTENALRKAIKEACKDGFDLSGLIHHSDRGVQYAYPHYTDLLLSCRCRISMTQSGDPRDNGLAERVNGILKTEWLNRYEFTSFKEVKKVLTKIIELYNNQRPHMGINMRIPGSVHQLPL